jgi:uncharacterized delta-60 repeat protein
MTTNYKVGGVWKQTTPYVNISSTWKVPKSIWQNVSGSWKSFFLQGGINDSGYNTSDNYAGFSTSSTISKIIVQSDDKMIVIGSLYGHSGTSSYDSPGGSSGLSLIRFNSDETVDTSFMSNLGSGFNDLVRSVFIQSDGKILVAGWFTSFNGLARNRLIRLNSDGTEDTAFYTSLGASGLFNGNIETVAAQSDGKIVVGGAFTSFNGVTRNRLLRLNSNGTVDTAFYTNLSTGFSDQVNHVLIQSDGDILVAGYFLLFKGVTKNYIVRLNSDGTEDTTFYTNLGTGFSDYITSMEQQSDAKIVIGGYFNSGTKKYLVRLNLVGTEDSTFTTNLSTGFNNGVESIAIQSDGDILVAGPFTSFKGVTKRYRVRLNSDGTEDTTFYTNLGTGPDSGIISIKIRSDNKILIGGSFTTITSSSINYSIKYFSILNLDGSLYSTAKHNNLTGFNNAVNTVCLQSDDKLLVGGSFTTINTTTSRNRIVRLNSDGTEDTAFYTNLGTGFNNDINIIKVQSDGKILVGGLFTSLNGATRNRLVRLNSDGTQDTAFYTNLGTGFDNAITSIALQSDGDILVGGYYTALNGVTKNSLVRLNSDGTQDTAFYTNLGTGFDNGVFSLAVQSDGKILVGGNYTALNGTTRNNLVRLNSAGTVDTAFYTNLGTGFAGVLSAISLQSDGKILVGGYFTSFNGLTRNYLIRLNSTGTEDTTFYTNLGSLFNNSVQSIVLQSDQKILVGGTFSRTTGIDNRLIRLNSDGTKNTQFTSNIGSGVDSYSVLSIAIQSDGKILIGGNFGSVNSVSRGSLARIGGDVAV